MSQNEVDEILNIETPIEETMKYIEPKKNQASNPVIENIMDDLKSKPYETTYNLDSIANKMPQKPISIPGTGLEFKQAEMGQPIIEVDIPKPVIQPNSLSLLLGTPDQGASAPITNFNLGSGSIAAKFKAQEQPPEVPRNVIPNPYKQITAEGGFGSLFGAPQQQRQSGGAERIIPIYKNTKNSPYQTNEEGRIKRERFIETHPDADRAELERNPPEEREPYRGIPESKTAFEIKLAPELLPPARRPLPPAPPENVVKMMNYIIPNSFGTQPNGIAQQFAQPSANVMSQNTYNISFANPSMVREFREDILPSKDESMLKYTMNTVSERLVIYQYIRSILIRQSDGENINFLSDKSPEVRNLLSYLRILDVEITKYDKLKNNPLGNLPRRLIIYRSCYPIRVDRANYNVGCAKNNIGINIRIYQMILGETFVNKYQTLPYKAFEVWREIAVYEQMRDSIVKSNMSPNFTMLYSYYITQDTEIDFLKINRLRNKDIIHKKEKEQKMILNQLYKEEMRNYLVGLQKYSTSDLTKLVNDLDIHKPSNKCLIALTESGTQDLISWGSRQYEDNGLAKKMINTGYHSYEIWLSILFQMYHSFLCMYKFGISFQKFDLNSNVLVKSLKQDEMNKGYWKYRVNGIDFHIPNYGFMVMINSDFADIIDNDEQTLSNLVEPPVPVGLPAHVYGIGARPPQTADIIAAITDATPRRIDKTTFKIYSDELLIHKTDLNVCKNKLRTLQNMRDAFNPNTFNTEFTINGGVPPTDSIKRIIQQIHADITSIVERETIKINIAETAELAAITNNVQDEDAIARVIEAAVDMVRIGRATVPVTENNIIIANAVLASTAQIKIEDAENKKEIYSETLTPEAWTALNNARDAVVTSVAAIPDGFRREVSTRANYIINQVPRQGDRLNPAGDKPELPRVTINADDLITTGIEKFKEFLHNRVGTSLKDGERMNLINSDDIDVGELVSYNNRWCVLTKKGADNLFNGMTVDQLAGNDSNIISKLRILKDIPIGDIMKTTLVIEQISKPNQKLSDNDLLETYELNFY